MIEIIINVIEEMRMERKIKMVISNKRVDEYVQVDITDINLQTIAEDKSLITNSDYD